jgi:PAS domain S-box-containing protein
MADTPSSAESPASPDSDDVATAVLASIERLALVCDETGTVVKVTDDLAALIGTDAASLVGRHAPTLFAADEDVFSAPPATDMVVLETDDGETHTLEARSRRLPDTGGNSLTGVFFTPDSGDGSESVGTVGDRFRQLFESVNDAILVIDTEDWQISECNARASELLGYDRDTLLAMDPREIHPHDFETFDAFVQEVTEDGSAWTNELSCYTHDGEIIPSEISGTTVTLDGKQQLLASIRDISTRVEQEVMLGRQSAAMQAATDGIAIFTDDGRIVYANAAYAELFGYEAADAITDAAWGDIHAEPDRFGLDISPALSTAGEWRGELTASGDRDDDLSIEASLTKLESDEVLCVAHDISDKRRHEERLTGLAAASRELLAAEDCTAVADAAIDTLEDVLGFELACLWHYDSEANELQRTAVSPTAEELLAEAVAYDLNRSRAGEAYRHEATVRNEPGDDAYAAGSRADLHVPLGEYGVLTVLAPEGSFTDQTVQLVELFAESVRAAFIRADREQQLRERRTELERRTDELTVATQFNDLVGDLIRSLLRSDHGDIERLVCERLADSPLYEGAWIAATDDSHDRSSDDDSDDLHEEVTVSAVTINTDAVPEATADAVATSPFGTRLIVETEATGEYVMSRREFDGSDAAAATETLAAAVPITAGPRQFGVLAVAGTDDRGFGEPVESGLRLLGETLGFAFSAELARSTLIADDAIELEFALGGPFAALSERLGCRCRYRGSVDADDGTQYRVEFDSATVDAVDEALRGLEAINGHRLVRESTDSCLFAVTVNDPSPALLADAGINLRSLVAENGEVRLVVEAPEDTDIGALQAQLADQYGRAELISKEHGRRERLAEGYSELLGEELTDKQLAAVDRAVEMGYFAWPREATAEEVADELGVASATFHQHLRAAEHKLISAFVETRS